MHICTLLISGPRFSFSFSLFLPLPLPDSDSLHVEEHQGADAMANIIYETQAFDMIFKYPIAEHLRNKIPDEPPVIGLAPGISDIEISSTSSAAMARKEAKLEQLRLAEEEKKKQQEQANLLSSLEAGRDSKDLEALAKDPKVDKEDRLQRYRHRFKKAMLKEGLVIEEDPNIDGDEMFLKIYTPFWRLCIEAQRLRYKVELTVREKKMGVCLDALLFCCV